MVVQWAASMPAIFHIGLALGLDAASKTIGGLM